MTQCKRILVLGGTGMLGTMTTAVLASHEDFSVTATYRNVQPLPLSNITWQKFDITTLLPDLAAFDGVVNCIGLIKQKIKDAEPEHMRMAEEINTLFPVKLADSATQSRTPLIQIATDCVFSGHKGPYDETSPHDASDVYGKTKSHGERPGSFSHLIRCSVIGPEFGATPVSLLGWFLSQPAGAKITGFTDHLWNGLTTLHFARLAGAVLRNPEFLPGLRHIVPADAVSKEELLRLFSASFGRQDITVISHATGTPCDRRLTTRYADDNKTLWQAAGHAKIPSIAEMIDELARDMPKLFPFLSAAGKTANQS